MELRQSSISCRLPNGDTIRCQSKAEALFVYNEIFEEQVYLRRGITVDDGDCILDIGANIGLFTMFVQQSRKSITTHAFEPSPELCAIIRENTAPYSDRVKLYQIGLSDQDGEGVFTFYPKYSILSGFHADASQESEMLRTALRNQYRSAFGNEVGLELRHLDSMIESILGESREYPCRLRRLSSVIREAAIDVVHLLKIDAERSELAVLKGIDENDWPRIRQVAAEVHDDRGNTLVAIEELLATHGFVTTVETEDKFKNAGIFNLYATRP